MVHEWSIDQWVKTAWFEFESACGTSTKQFMEWNGAYSVPAGARGFAWGTAESIAADSVGAGRCSARQSTQLGA